MAELICKDGTKVQISDETETELRKAFGPKHVWEHGDVFTVDHISLRYMIYICDIFDDTPRVFHLSTAYGVGGSVETYLEDATFLFNIKDKI